MYPVRPSLLPLNPHHQQQTLTCPPRELSSKAPYPLSICNFMSGIPRRSLRFAKHSPHLLKKMGKPRPRGLRHGTPDIAKTRHVSFGGSNRDDRQFGEMRQCWMLSNKDIKIRMCEVRHHVKTTTQHEQYVEYETVRRSEPERKFVVKDIFVKQKMMFILIRR